MIYVVNNLLKVRFKLCVVGSVDEDTSSVLSKSCVDIDNSGTSSGLAPSFLRKSVIDPSVAQSFQRSLYHTPKYYTTPSKYVSIAT